MDMTRRLVTLTAATALLLSSVAPSFADHNRGGHGGSGGGSHGGRGSWSGGGSHVASGGWHGGAGISASPDGRHVAAAGVNGGFAVWELATGREVFSVETDSRISNVVWSPDESLAREGQAVPVNS